jgi:UrcA family protein
MNTSLTRIPIAAIAMIAVVATGARASDVRQMRVNCADLNLETQAGAVALFQRIRFAAEQVCAVRGTRDLVILAKVRACTDHAIADAIAAANNTKLTEIYEVKMGRG